MIFPLIILGVAILNVVIMGLTPIADHEIRHLPKNDVVLVDSMVEDLSRARVVLVGEQHDNPYHHQIQLTVIQKLHKLRPNMVVAVEMFPHHLQPVLDQWIEGTLTETEFLDGVEWYYTWSFDPELYLPIFRFLREKKIPLIAMNIRREVVSQVRRKGLSSLDSGVREQLPPFGPQPDKYQSWLKEVFNSHPMMAKMSKLEHFYQAQKVWDGVMAGHIFHWLNSHPNDLVVGLAGAGHVVRDYGIVSQLNFRGVQNVSTVLPWVGSDRWLEPDVADYAWGSPVSPDSLPPVRLGVLLDDEVEGVHIKKVTDASVAFLAGLKEKDEITHLDGRSVVSRHALVRELRSLKWGSFFTLDLIREGEKKRQRVELPKKE